MSEQPTLDELKDAVECFFQCAGSEIIQRAAFGEVLRLRRAKTTWVGKEENDYRYRIDDLCDKVQPGWNTHNPVVSG